MIDISKFDPARRREVEIKGEKFILQCTDPYGYWYIHRPKGQMPASLAQTAYTEYVYALRALEQYMTLQPVPAPVQVPHDKKK